jgi:hypothetical protein
VLGLDDIAYDPDSGVVGEPDAIARVDASVDASMEGTDTSMAGTDGSAEAAEPSFPLTIAQGPAGSAALGLAIDDTRIYWVSSGANGSVLSVLKDGGGLTTIATGQEYPLDIAVQGTSVFWSVTPAGTGPQCMARVAATPGSTPDGGDAGPSCVVSSSDVTVRMTLGGTSLVLLAQGTGGNATNEYVGVVSAGETFSSVETQGPSSAIAATAQQAFLGNKNGEHVDELALTGLTFGNTICTSDCADAVIVDITTDVSLKNVLWISQSGSIDFAPIAVNGAKATEYAQLSGVLQRMARDASYIYVTVLGLSVESSSSVLAVQTAPGADAGTFITLSGAENNPFGIVVDESAVYWGDAVGRIRKAPVPPPPP